MPSASIPLMIRLSFSVFASSPSPSPASQFALRMSIAFFFSSSRETSWITDQVFLPQSRTHHTHTGRQQRNPQSVRHTHTSTRAASTRETHDGRPYFEYTSLCLLSSLENLGRQAKVRSSGSRFDSRSSSFCLSIPLDTANRSEEGKEEGKGKERFNQRDKTSASCHRLPMGRRAKETNG